jgi:hypothetical protein
MAGQFGDKEVERWVRRELGKLVDEIDGVPRPA